MASGNRFVSWLIKLMIKVFIHIVALALCAGTIYLLYLKFGEVAYFALLAFGAIYYAIITSVINSFVDEVLMKR